MLRLIALCLVLLVGGPAQAGTVETYDKVRAALLAVWADTPLTARNVALTKGPATGFGNYVPAAVAVYAPGDKINIYAELVGYGWEVHADGSVATRFSLDLALRTKAGKTVATMEDFTSIVIPSLSRNLETYLALEAILADFAPGDYVLAYRVRDLAGGKETGFEVPITLRP